MNKKWFSANNLSLNTGKIKFILFYKLNKKDDIKSRLVISRIDTAEIQPKPNF